MTVSVGSKAKLPKGFNCVCLYLLRPGEDAQDERGGGKRVEKGLRTA